jgi:hypothetical protein
MDAALPGTRSAELPSSTTLTLRVTEEGKLKGVVGGVTNGMTLCPAEEKEQPISAEHQTREVLPNDPKREVLPNDLKRGALAKQLIQCVLRRTYGLFRSCYEQGLNRDPTLAGRIAVRFVIDKTGAVVAVQRQQSLPDERVNLCIEDGFRAVQFPPPRGDGIVTVVYPISFAPGP